MLASNLYRIRAYCGRTLLVFPSYKSHLSVSPRIVPLQLGESRFTATVRFQRRDLHQPGRTENPPVVSFGRSIWNKLFGKYLLATNILSSGILMVIGDLVAQEIEYRRHCSKSKFDVALLQQPQKLNFLMERYDVQRIWRMFVVGALQGPLHHYVYKWMDHAMPVANVRNTLRKILIDQIFMSPACILIFFYSACYLENRSVKETNTELCDKFPVIYLIDWSVWPAAQYINFRYLDTKYRVMFVNVCTALYNIFLSYIKHDY